MKLLSINIINWLEEHQLPCLFKMAFHRECPGCGIQRSFIALLKGDIPGSFAFYPALIPIFLFFIYLAADRRFQFRFSGIITKTSLACIFIIILASYIYKLTFQSNLL